MPQKACEGGFDHVRTFAFLFGFNTNHVFFISPIFRIRKAKCGISNISPVRVYFWYLSLFLLFYFSI